MFKPEYKFRLPRRLKKVVTKNANRNGFVITKYVKLIKGTEITRKCVDVEVRPINNA